MFDLVDLHMPEDEVHVWFVFPEKISDRALLARYHELLNPAEAKQQARFYFEKHRHQYLVTRALIRTLLSRYAPATPPSAWRFEKNEYGRPAIAADHNAPPLHFNLSHTDGLIACAVALEREVGVDVEHIGRGGDLIPLADRFFSPAEVTDLHRVPEPRQISRFFDYWTLKESYIKARGMGLSIPLDQFSFHIDDTPSLALSVDPAQKDPPERWQFKQWDLAPDHKVALALERQAGTCFRIRLNQNVPYADDEPFTGCSELRGNFD